jgi:hypothetical protein
MNENQKLNMWTTDGGFILDRKPTLAEAIELAESDKYPIGSMFYILQEDTYGTNF